MENERLAKLVEEAKGDRSIRDYSRDSGVNPTTISMIISKGYTPSSSIIKKLGRPEARPQGGVTIQDLMIAAGYIEDYRKTNYIVDIGKHEVVLERAGSIGRSEPDRIERFREYAQFVDRFGRIASGVIYTALAKKGIMFTTGKGADFINVRGFEPDICVRLQDGSSTEWWFDFRKTSDRIDIRRTPPFMFMYSIMGNYALLEPDKNRKLSTVLDDEMLFDILASYKGKTSYRGDLSIILIDPDEMCIKKEEYIAFYDLDDEEGNKPKLI